MKWTISTRADALPVGRCPEEGTEIIREVTFLIATNERGERFIGPTVGVGVTDNEANNAVMNFTRANPDFNPTSATDWVPTYAVYGSTAYLDEEASGELAAWEMQHSF